MGMDVYGRNDPEAYFRRNVWGWRPLADYVIEHHPQIAIEIAPPEPEEGEARYEIPADMSYNERMNMWHYNSGWGLLPVDAAALILALEADIAQGVVEKHIFDKANHLLSLPRETCRQCEGTGIRTDEIGVRYGWPEKIVVGPDGNPRMGQTGSCNGCNGWGTNVPFEANYTLDSEDIPEFVEYLKTSGGFQIW